MASGDRNGSELLCLKVPKVSIDSNLVKAEHGYNIHSGNDPRVLTEIINNGV